jgi:small subunit ribosomal protein S25e
MPPKQQEKAAKADKNQQGKKAKKKWSKGKTREALNNAILWEKPMIEKLKTEVPKYKVITPSIVSDRLKVSVALAGEGLRFLAKQGTIRLVSNSGKFTVYSRAIPAPGTETAAAAPVAAPKAEKTEKKPKETPKA